MADYVDASGKPVPRGERVRKLREQLTAERLGRVIAFARETWTNDGAEGETVHTLCNNLETLLARAAALDDPEITGYVHPDTGRFVGGVDVTPTTAPEGALQDGVRAIASKLRGWGAIARGDGDHVKTDIYADVEKQLRALLAPSDAQIERWLARERARKSPDDDVERCTQCSATRDDADGPCLEMHEHEWPDDT